MKIPQWRGCFRSRTRNEELVPSPCQNSQEEEEGRERKWPHEAQECWGRAHWAPLTFLFAALALGATKTPE